MLRFLLSAFQILSMVTGNPLDSSRYLIDSQPLLFLEEADTESQVVNSTLILKKKFNSDGQVGPVFFNDKKKDGIINNHHLISDVGTVWRRPVKPISGVISNHKGTVHWDQKRFQMSTTKSPPPFGIKQVHQKEVVINNHNPAATVKGRPSSHRPSSLVSITDSILTIPPTEVLGDRIKFPDTIKSAAIKVLNASRNVKTTIKRVNNGKIIVIQKRTDNISPNSVQEDITATITKPENVPDRGNFSFAAVMDPWSNIPIPSRPWPQSSTPVKVGLSRPIASQTVVPNLPFMPFFSSLISPLLNKPLTSSAVNTGMQGIKAMQGFLRNSLMGAMFCFLPSAFIALSLTATQRAQLRKIPEVDDMMFYCKKCLENLKNFKDLGNSTELNWINDIL